jgi:hypothetical protein
MRMTALLAAVIALLVASACAPQPDGPKIEVSDVNGLRAAARTATPGTTITLAPGDYPGGIFLSNIHGEADKPITIAAADPARPPRIVGGTEALHLSEVTYLELRNLVTTGQPGNGINIDDGGTFDSPSHHLVLDNLAVNDVGPAGNNDGIKLSGVDDFVVRGCRVDSWGAGGGSGIDMVGCHRGRIEECHFHARETGAARGANAIQAKGGTSDLVVYANRFEEVGDRGVNIGGSTGLQFFRPKPEGFEAKNITVEGNVFTGSTAPVAFAGADGATVRFNTFVLPGKWLLRILQETVLPEFAPCRKGVLTDNIIVFQSDHWAEGGCNIGPNTAPETFQFARNLWFCQDKPDRSKPTLPTAEQDGVYGVDPQFVDADNGDFALRPGSPAAGKGHTACPKP